MYYRQFALYAKVSLAVLLFSVSLFTIMAAAPLASQSLADEIRQNFPVVQESLGASASFRESGRELSGHTVMGLVPILESNQRLGAASSNHPAEFKALQALHNHSEDETPFSVFIPTFYREGFQIEGGGVSVSIRSVDAAESVAEVEGGTIVFRNAYPDTDVLYTFSRNRCEEFILLKSEGAPLRFEYLLAAMEGVESCRLRNGEIVFKDQSGKGIKIEKPWMVDSLGRDAEGQIHLELGPTDRDGTRVISLEIDPTGLAYPLLVDPSWTLLDTLITARYNHTATLLHTGEVLVAGGYPSAAAKSAELYDPAEDTWTATGSMTYDHYSHTATLLQNGTVLVVGGPSRSVRCEIYDPDEGTWSTADDLNTGRNLHTATLLSDGKVLVAGGDGTTNNATASCELYDPGADSWTATDSMSTERRYHSATLLPNGEVFVAGGWNYSDSHLLSCELFDPDAGGFKWSSADDMNDARREHTATLMPDGDVLVAGGYDNAAMDECETYDYGSDAWTTTDTLGAARYRHGAALRPDGKVLAMGGVGGSQLSSTELYDSDSSSWASGAAMDDAREHVVSVVMPGGRILVPGGKDGSGQMDETEIYSWVSGSFSDGDSMSESRGRYPSASIMPDGKVLVTGGYNGTNYHLDSADIFDPSSGWDTASDMDTERSNHQSVLLPSGDVMVIGGVKLGGSTATCEIYDASGDSWSTTTSMNTGRYWSSAVLLADGRVLVCGGLNGGTALSSCEIYDPDATPNPTWTTTTAMNSARRGHRAVLLPDGKVLVAGGHNGSSYLTSCEIFDPDATPNPTWTTTTSMNTARSFYCMNLLRNGEVLVAGGQNSSGWLASTETFDPVATPNPTWTSEGSLGTSRAYSASVLRPDGLVQMFGGFNGSFLSSTELFDPQAGSWSTEDSMDTARGEFIATLLCTGKVLVAGGRSAAGSPESSAEVFDIGLGHDSSWPPSISGTPDNIDMDDADEDYLHIDGSNFEGISEASGGGNRNSSTNYPLVLLTRIDNEQNWWIPAESWDEDDFDSLDDLDNELSNLNPGHCYVTVFVNGIPGDSKIIRVEP